MSFRIVVALILFSAAFSHAAPPLSVTSPEMLAAVGDPNRPVAQVNSDNNRKPAQVIAFAGVKSGDRVADFMSGNAYFTRILSKVVGEHGRLYAFLPTEEIKNCSPDEIAGTLAIEHDAHYPNVSVLKDAVANFSTPEQLDVIWTAQNYHDLHNTFMGPADVAAVNKAFFQALKPGGIFLVIDHVAKPGSRLRDTETLHRIDPTSLRNEIEAAGFVFEAQSDALRNARDDHQRRIFDPDIRGRTDQVVFRFRKPGKTWSTGAAYMAAVVSASGDNSTNRLPKNGRSNRI